jgi:acylphosphatase
MTVMPARLFLISGRVQGVGYRNFARKEALALGLRGYARNLADGRVEVAAVGGEAELSEFAGRLAKGPVWGHVRHIEARDASQPDATGFEIL